MKNFSYGEKFNDAKIFFFLIITYHKQKLFASKENVVQFDFFFWRKHCIIYIAFAINDLHIIFGRDIFPFKKVYKSEIIENYKTRFSKHQSKAMVNERCNYS